jgi:hypothetical protein
MPIGFFQSAFFCLNILIANFYANIKTINKNSNKIPCSLGKQKRQVLVLKVTVQSFSQGIPA